MNKAVELPIWDTKVTEYVKTDSTILNEALGGGLRTSNLVVLQAPTGEGKTTFLMRLAINSLIAKKKVLFISIGEQREEEIFTKMACMRCKVKYNGNNKTDYSDEDAERIEDSKNKSIFENLYVQYVEDKVPVTTLEEAVNNGIKYVFIDYMGACLADNIDEQYTFLTRMAAELKNFADKYNICIVTAMQTSRNLVSTELKKDDLDLSTINESFMADSIGPARKATVCLSLFTYKGKKYLVLYKNRLNGEKKVIQLDITPVSYEWVEFFKPEEGF